MKALIKSYAQAIFEASVGQPKAKVIILVDNLLKEMSLKNILADWPSLITELEKLNNAKEKIIQAEIKVARQLPKKTLEEIVNFIKKRTGAEQVIYKELIVPKLGGGFIASFGDTIIDASLETTVNELAAAIGR